MVLVSNVQMLEPRPYDYSKYVVDNIQTNFVNFNDVEYPTFKDYSLFMHMVLYFRQMKVLWGEGLKLNLRESNGDMELVQMWMSVWDYRLNASYYLTFEVTLCNLHIHCLDTTLSLQSVVTSKHS